MHGGEVLHRSADRRPRSRMRPGVRRVSPGRRPASAPAERRPFAPPRPDFAGAYVASANAAVQREPGVAMADAWFETVALAHERAKRRLPKPVYAALVAASEK